MPQFKWPPEEKPDEFLKVTVKELEIDPMLIGLDAGFENGYWRADGLAQHLMEWIPEFALSPEEYNEIKGANAVRRMQEAARRVYASDHYRRRGEFGELLLHVAQRQEFHTAPVISKLFFKLSKDDTVKGFDGVHVRHSNGDLELWLGEAKLYTDPIAAIREAVNSLDEHSQIEYLKSEFLLILPKISSGLPFYSDLQKLLDQNTSLDDVFDVAVFPVMIAYESNTLEKYSEWCDEYIDDICKEIEELYEKFCSNTIIKRLHIRIFFMPLGNIEEFREIADEKLKKMQG